MGSLLFFCRKLEKCLFTILTYIGLYIKINLKLYTCYCVKNV